MHSKLLSTILFITLLAAFGFVSYAQGAEVSAGKGSAQPPYYVEIKSDAVYIDRSKKFAMGNIADVIGGTGRNIGNIDFDMGKWGGGYGVVVGTTKLEPIKLEASFEQFFASFDKAKGDIPHDPVGFITLTNLGAMPFIDGNHGVTGQGFVMGVNPTSPIAYDFRYSLDYLSCNINMVYEALQKNGFEISFFGGPVYTHFKQKYTIETNGGQIPFQTVSTSSLTKEKLTDNLFGGRLGMKGQKKLFDKFFISSNVSTDLYYRHSRFKGTQELVNAITSDTALLPGNPLDSSLLERKQTKNSFVPRLTSNVILSYELLPNITISTFYQFDHWWNLTKIVNPEVQFNTATGAFTQNGSSRIEKEKVSSHSIGSGITVIF